MIGRDDESFGKWIGFGIFDFNEGNLIECLVVGIKLECFFEIF